jgi:hypothetical protein
MQCELFTYHDLLVSHKFTHVNHGMSIRQSREYDLSVDDLERLLLRVRLHTGSVRQDFRYD